MEFDSQSQSSDDGTEILSGKYCTKHSGENGDLYQDYSFSEDSQPQFLEARIVYLLMQRNVPVSRATRLQWLLDHLNTTITASQKIMEPSSNLEVISVIPREQTNTKCNRFLVTHRTEIKFLAHSYRFVYCLDMSPSHANVDIQKGEILLDEILNCFKSSLCGLCREFTIPGNDHVFSPSIYLTVIANTPFFMSPAQQVLVKGVLLTSENLNEVIRYVEGQFHLLEGKLADVSATALDQLNFQRAQSEALVGSLFDLPETGKLYSRIAMVSPDVNFVNMLRYSMLAITLLPDNSISHILVITDGIVAMPDSNIMETLLFQLHYDSIAVSFLKVGSSFHPHSSAGFVSYTDLLHFFSRATLGCCLENFIQVKPDPSLSLNLYHELFLLWSFHHINRYTAKYCDTTRWNPGNDTFCSHKVPTLLSKRQTDENTSASILLLIYRRMREGFTVDGLYCSNGNLEMKLILQWKSSIYMHYKLSSQWPSIKNSTHFEVCVSAPYEFFHDITSKESKSLYRQAIIERFWLRLSQLSQGDLGLAQQLSCFQNNKDWYTLPESVRNGIPVFILNNSGSTDAMKLILIPSDPSYPKFVNIWQPVCQMETSNWRKWLHVHKVSLILRHDHPLPKYLHLANSSQRYQVVQCRQAAAALYGYLAEWASFVLIDNHTYLKLLTKESGKPPLWFCIVRVSSKFPCVVLNIGFTTGTPSQIRFEVCEQLKHEISLLCYSSNPVKIKDNLCCMLLQKPLEKILIRYERIPNSYTTVVFPDGTQPPHTSCLSLPSPVTGSLFTTLSRYLFHKRWIWSATLQANPKLPDNSISRILSTLTSMRLREGYSFAHSSSGIITMVIELWMEPTATCIVQYVLFPPHCWLGDDIYSGSEEDNEQSSDSEAELQMVTEVWIEPQYGKVVPNHPRISYIDNKAYYEIADAICKVDLQCIGSLLTMEHLSSMCQEKSDDRFNLSGTFNNISQITVSRKSYSRRNSKNSYLESPSMLARSRNHLYPITSPRIEHMPFKFDPISILPLCQQTELTFSMFIESREKSYVTENSADKANMLLLENILEHLALIHDQELELAKEDSDRFTQEVLLRHKNTSSHACPISENLNCRVHPQEKEDKTGSQWRCFIKGVSETHVILTFIAASLDDLKNLLAVDHTNIPSLDESIDSTERASSRGSNFSDVPITSTNSVCLPIYVFDCPLRGLVNAYINNGEDVPPTDVYEDHRFKHGDIHEECIKLKEDCDIPLDPKEDNDNQNGVRQHCKTLIVTHSKCFTISLFIALHRGIFIHSYDVQSAIDQCEESVTEIDITEYIMTVCAHVKQLDSDHMLVKDLNQAHPCYELRKLHSLIKEKFFKMLNTVFYPIPTNSEYYFFKNLKNAEPVEEMSDSDDEISENPSEVVFKSEISIYSEGPHLLQRMESGISGISEVNSSEVEPLFLHLICTLRYGHGEQSHTSVRVIPTCLGELIQNLEPSIESLEKSNIHVTLDMLCLTLPSDVENIINDYSSNGMRTTSFCSDGFQPSIGSNVSDGSFIPEISEPLKRLSENQMKSVLKIRDEIKWLLRDEICTALLDTEPVTMETLNYVIKHVSDGTAVRSSCVLDHINLNFVYSTGQSYEKFLEEFKSLTLVCGRYKLCKEQDLFYLAKDPKIPNTANFMRPEQVSLGTNPIFLNLGSGFGDDMEGSVKEIFTSVEDMVTMDPNYQESSQPSEISSMNESAVGTDGYEDDDEYEDYDWLTTLDNKRQHLSNFWLILKISQDVVTIYFHCRFLELPTYRVGVYIEVQRAVREAVRDMCKKVNQLLLLQSLYDTKSCDPLLEPDDCNECNTPISRNASFARLKALEVEDPTDFDLMMYSTSLSEASLNLKPGYFSCPVVWETPFILHPRLKTGPGKSGISRGILALKTILDKFSVSNRNNMFVYKDNQNNVFYLRLHENVQNSGTKLSLMRSNEYESGPVSRSPSIASLPLGQNKSNLTQSEQSITSTASGDIRPRVRSFGEKESKDTPNEDTLILKVHGITEAGSDVQNDLVQVLQNRLDDAVLEFLSIMLARNAMCPLTPEDVHFVQKPFRPPEVVVRLTIQEFALQYLDSFVHYLKQNLLQFLNIPKYTDSRTHFHFKDYAENEEGNHLACEDNIFIYNQSQNPSAGSRGIACIALALVSNSQRGQAKGDSSEFARIFETENFDTVVSSEIIPEDGELPHSYIEFRLWKQGRVNIENLSQKMEATVSQATWDIVMEYFLLTQTLCVESSKTKISEKCPTVELAELNLDWSKEIEFNCILSSSCDNYVRPTIYCDKPKIQQYLTRKKRTRPLRAITIEETDEMNNSKMPVRRMLKPNELETGDCGSLSVVYSKYLQNWLEFGFSLNTPSVKKHKITLANRHLPNIIITELVNMLQDSPKVFRCFPTNCLKTESEDIFVPYVPSNLIPKCIIICRNIDHWMANVKCRTADDFPDYMSPQNLKHTQKFVPAICNNNFIPRQKILWISVENDNILIYTYNWVKDNVDKLINTCTNLGYWLNVRSSFINSITSQKLGIFYNQPLTRKVFMIPNNPYTNIIGNVECTLSFSRDHAHKRAQPAFNFAATLEAFRDNYRICKYASLDPAVTFTLEIREMKSLEKRGREEMKTLHGMYQSRTSTVTVQQIYMLIQNSRIVHYCHTPLLFLPRWRLKSASTRDHSLYPSQAIQLADVMASEEKEMWHTELCYGFFLEYRHYLQTLGFIPLQINNPHTTNAIWTNDKSSYNNVFYIQKTILGGILIFTVEFSEPFFVTKLLAIECNRLQNITTRVSIASINRFTLSFVDECDRVKVLMHLHSFTYDYHLRSIYNYISGSQTVNRVCEKYNVYQFLDDFMKYYNKAPNFARNLVHTDTLTIKNLVTEGKQLFDYLLSNIGQYNFKVFEMDVWDGEPEYILVQVTTTPQMSYKDSQDCQHTDDFDITLVVYNLCTPYSPKDNVLHLKYYLILTSKREIYPKSEIEEKLGKFRTVSSTARSLSSTTDKDTNSNPNLTETFESSNEHTNISRKNSSGSINQEESSTQSNSLPYVQLSQEIVNYLGYYSSHEQLMQQLILDRAHTTQKHIKDMVSKGMVHCRTHLLWNRLIAPQELNGITYEEFLELKNLAKLEHLCEMHPNLGPLLNQPLSWYQGLSKLLLNKYVDHNRTFISPDGNVQHYVILHQRYFGAFMLLSLDLHTSRGDLYAVFREPHKQEDADLCLAYQKSLLDGFVNCICFYLWSGMISN